MIVLKEAEMRIEIAIACRGLDLTPLLSARHEKSFKCKNTFGSLMSGKTTERRIENPAPF